MQLFLMVPTEPEGRLPVTVLTRQSEWSAPLDLTKYALDTEIFGELLEMEETHFVDLKSADISPAKLTKTVSAFANTSGGGIHVGIEESIGPNGKQRLWEGFADQEAANPIFQVLELMNPLGNSFSAEFLTAAEGSGLGVWAAEEKTSKKWHSWGWLTPYQGRDNAANAILRGRN
jgi:hypothetical protein